MFQNFVPQVYSAALNTDLERECVFVEDCNTEYEGTIKKQGDSVRILGVGKPTITTIAKSSGRIKLDSAESIEDTSSVMYINRVSYYNYCIDDIDEAQAVKGIEGTLKKETSEQLANEIDTYIASFAKSKDIRKLYATPVKVVAKETDVEGERYVLDVLDDAILALRENDVNSNTKIVVTVSWKFYSLLKKAYTKLDTNNSEEIKHGRVGMYNGVVIKCSNNVVKDDDGIEHSMMRTKKAVAYACPKIHAEAYRPQDGFTDAIKGYILYDAKVVRPKEVVDINVKYA